VLSGEWVAGMGMTEPGAGTDVLGMTTTAVRDGDDFVLNGTKTYITNGCEGFCFLVYAKVDGRITAFVVDRDCPGFSTSQHIDKLGMRGSTMSELIFEDCRVPAANLLGEPRQRAHAHDAQPRDRAPHAGRDERRHRRSLRRDHGAPRPGAAGLRQPI
jgi:alkylation response protein AidB-like acyl-CoA dehydrogenase